MFSFCWLLHTLFIFRFSLDTVYIREVIKVNLSLFPFNRGGVVKVGMEISIHFLFFYFDGFPASVQWPLSDLRWAPDIERQSPGEEVRRKSKDRKYFFIFTFQVETIQKWDQWISVHLRDSDVMCDALCIKSLWEWCDALHLLDVTHLNCVTVT